MTESVGGFNRDQLDDAIAKVQAEAEKVPEPPPDIEELKCKGCGMDMTVRRDARVPTPVEPTTGILVRNIASGSKDWYHSTECFYANRPK